MSNEKCLEFSSVKHRAIISSSMDKWLVCLVAQDQKTFSCTRVCLLLSRPAAENIERKLPVYERQHESVGNICVICKQIPA